MFNDFFSDTINYHPIATGFASWRIMTFYAAALSEKPADNQKYLAELYQV